MKRARWWITGAALALPLLTACEQQGYRDRTLYSQQGPAAEPAQKTEDAQRTPQEADRSQMGIGGSFGSGAESGGKFEGSGTEGGGTVMQGKEGEDVLLHEKSP